MMMLMMALGEDLDKCLPKCANKYCQRLKPKNAKTHGWERRSILGHKEWLCEKCNLAYSSKQFCEFCLQIYLENTAEFSDLDGKQWAQCEGLGRCDRWAHIECLAKTYGKTEREIAAKSFKYTCSTCKTQTNKRKRITAKRTSKLKISKKNKSKAKL